MRPQTPLMPIVVRMSGIDLDRLDDFVQIVGHLHGAVGVSGAADAALAQHFFKRVLIGAVVSDRRRRIFQLMARKYANDALVGADDALMSQLAAAGDARRRSGLTTQAAGTNLGLGVQNLLIRDLTNDALTTFQSAQRLVETDRPIDF